MSHLLCPLSDVKRGDSLFYCLKSCKTNLLANAFTAELKQSAGNRKVYQGERYHWQYGAKTSLHPMIQPVRNLSVMVAPYHVILQNFCKLNESLVEPEILKEKLP